MQKIALEKLKKKNIYQVPVNYFEKLHDEILRKTTRTRA